MTENPLVAKIMATQKLVEALIAKSGTLIPGAMPGAAEEVATAFETIYTRVDKVVSGKDIAAA